MLIVQISYETASGGIVPLAISRNRTLAREVARRIRLELESLDGGDKVTRELARLESRHLEDVMQVVDLSDKKGDAEPCAAQPGAA